MRRMTMRPKLTALATGLLLMAGVSFIFGATGELRWGGDAEGGAPYVFPDPKDPREIVGFEVDLANALGRELNRRAVFVQNQWDGIISGLKRGNYDVVLNGLEITEDRKREISFTIPYFATAEQLSVRSETNSIHSLADLKGKTVGTLKFSLAQRVLEGERGIKLRTYDGQINAYEDLTNGRLDAVLMDWPIALYCHKQVEGLKFLGQPIGQMQYGIGVRKEDAVLLKQLNEALLVLVKNCEMKRIYEEWGLWNTETETLFADMTKAPQAFEDYTNSVAKKKTLGERARLY